MCYAYQKQSGVEVRVARIFNTFGPRMHIGDGRVVSNFIIQVSWKAKRLLQRQTHTTNLPRLCLTHRPCKARN